MLVQGQLDVRYPICHRGIAAAAAGDLPALEVAARLTFDDGVFACGKIVEAITALGVGGRRGDKLAALVQKANGTDRERLLAGVKNAVAVGIGKDPARDAARLAFAEVAVDAPLPPQQRDIANLVAEVDRLADGLAVDRAGGVQ